MREILFRCRNAGNKIVMPDFMKREFMYELFNNENFIVEQFTGLTDKNGVKIFEGDILRNPPKTQWEEENYVTFEVFWHDNNHAEHHIGWQFNRLHFHGSVGGYNMHERFIPKYTEQMVVIGNIHDTEVY